ncbi:MAG: discoidin domain-containing protein [Myxococcales bacterium]|nr:discoidin domain-containing protein [Myxococcales bacterium]
MLALALLAHAHAAPVKIASVTAKSSYSNEGVNYPADNVKDGKASTPWFEGESGNGVGSWIEVDLGGTHNVTRFAILAGDWSSGSAWGKANRPKELQIQWSDGSTDTWALNDEWRPQVFTPSSPKSTSSIRLKVNQLYNGSAFPDTAISEILVWDDAEAPTAVVTGVTASSEFPSDADGAYYAAQAADEVRDTYWCEGNKKTDGVGEWLEFTFDHPTRITGVSMCSGMCTTPAELKKTAAPSRVTMQFSDGTTQSVDVKAIMPLPQNLTISPVTTSSVKITIDAVRAGSEFQDACISEVTFKK